MAPLLSPVTHGNLSLDNSYDSSTFPTNEGHCFTNFGPIHQSLEPIPATSRTRSRVCFDPLLQVAPTDYYFEADERWWTAEELDGVRQDARKQSQRLRQSSSEALCMAHRKTTLILSGDFGNLVKLPPTSPDQDLQEWCAFNDGRRGLERFCSKVYHSFRRKDVQATRAAVLKEQECQRTARDMDPEALAQVSRDASRRARNFALFFGGADAKESNKRSRVIRRNAPPRKKSRMVSSSDDEGEIEFVRSVQRHKSANF